MSENTDADAWKDPEWQDRTCLLLDSYERYTERTLIPRVGRAEDSQKLFEAPFVVVAHGTEDDPLLNYANLAALELWKLPLSELLGMPSRKTAEPVHRDERSQLLERTRKYGYIDDYSGIRIASTGERFRIHQATVWNVTAADGKYRGQAAAFSEWTMLES